jgi:RND family efflux transporter MFP subunit
MRRLVILAAAVLALGLAALLAMRVRREEPARATATTPRGAATAAPLAPGAPPFIGVIFPRQQVDVAAAAAARVEEIKVQVGSRLAAGDVIATLDAESLRRELKAAEAAVRGARAEAQAARVEHDAAVDKVARLEQFTEAIPGEERIDAALKQKMSATRIASATARVAEAVARVEQLRLLVESSAVVAPFAGVVSARYVDPGTQVGPGKPIVRIISADDLWVRFAVPEERAGEVRAGGCLAVTTSSPPIEAAAVIATVSPQVDTELRILFAEARLALPTGLAERPQAGLAASVVLRPCPAP